MLMLLGAGHSQADTIKTTLNTAQFFPVRERMYTQSLNGTWKIKILEGLTVPSKYSAWLDEDFDDTSWMDVAVPGNWETQGLKSPEYGCDLGEYIGLYRTRFAYNKAWSGKHVILRFDGVHFGYECFINRLVRLAQRFGGDCRRHARFSPEEEGYCVNVSLKDMLNNHILDFTKAVDCQAKRHTFTGEVTRPRLWSAETPNLYALEISITDSKDYVVQRINERVGIREIRVEGYDLKINHRPVHLRGVCWNEINPKTGKYITYEERRRQLQMMKQANVNFIRTAHYPFAPDFYRLCDEMGFYVCNEVPFGSRGAAHLRDKDYLPVLIARADATLRRDRNRPSVVIWSLGNENPYTPIVEEVLKYVKEKDPRRPRGLPQKVGDFMNFSQKPSKNVDVIMGHYLSPARIDAAIKNTRIPIIHTEYAHSLGLAFGDLESKYARILREEKVIGGSVWCWSDQTIMTQGDLQKNHIMKGVRLDSLHYIDCYGKSVADGDRKEIWKEAADGIVYGNGYPQEDFFLVRKVYSPVVITTEKLEGLAGESNSTELTVENRFDFRSLSGYTLKWELRNIRKTMETGCIQLRAEARQAEKISLQYVLPGKADINDWMLYTEVVDAEGKIITEKSIPIEIAGNGKAEYLSLIESLPTYKRKTARASGKNASLRTENFSLTIDDGSLLESGLTLKQNPDFDTFRWLGNGPFSSTPGKTMFNERDCWVLHKDDIRFDGNRGKVDMAVVTDKAHRGVGLWSDNGNIGIENIDGSIFISQNAVVCGYGSKFADHEGRESARNKKICGSLILFIDQLASPVPFLDQLFKPYQSVVPEKPYMESYGR